MIEHLLPNFVFFPSFLQPISKKKNYLPSCSCSFCFSYLKDFVRSLFRARSLQLSFSLLSFPPNAAHIFFSFFLLFFFFLFFLRHVICYVFLFTVITCFNKCSLLATILLSLIMYSIFCSHSLLSEGSTIYKLCFSVDLSISSKYKCS